MDLRKYSTLIKILCIIPFAVGILTFIELLLPNTYVETVVTEKSESYRARTNSTTYTIEFENINDQFTEDIYLSIDEGTLVRLEVSPVHKQIKSIEIIDDAVVLKNSTGESYAIFGFGIVFLLCALAWLKKGQLSLTQSKYIPFIILISLIMGIRMLV